jgi:hypothetical protein
VLLEVGDELRHRLLRHLRAGREDADARPGVIEELEHAPVREPHVRMPALGEPVHELVGHREERLAEQDREVLGCAAGARVGESA